jgi:hypothetical protein
MSIHSTLFYESGPTNAQLKRQLDNEVARHTDLIEKYSIATERLWALERAVVKTNSGHDTGPEGDWSHWRKEWEVGQGILKRVKRSLEENELGSDACQQRCAHLITTFNTPTRQTLCIVCSNGRYH